MRLLLALIAIGLSGSVAAAHHCERQWQARSIALAEWSFANQGKDKHKAHALFTNFLELSAAHEACEGTPLQSEGRTPRTTMRLNRPDMPK